jgi:glycosyl transferase, family 25
LRPAGAVALVQINLINLDRSPGRLAAFNAANHFLPPIRRCPGIDGRTLDRLQLTAAGLLAPGLGWTDGAVGNGLSHIRLWQEAVQTKLPVTVAEDDVIFNRHFLERAPALLATLPLGWEFVLWGWNFDVYIAFELVKGAGICISHLDQASLAQGLSEFQSQRFTPLPFRLIRAFGQPCYTIAPQGAAKLLAHCLPFRAETVALPEVKGSVVAQDVGVLAPGAYPSLQAYLSFPPLAASPNDPALSTVLPSGR